MGLATRMAVMERGRLLQVDSPRAIYERPANRLVASFIGQVNLLPGELRAEAGGWRFHCPALATEFVLEAAPPAGPALLALRPERLRLLRPGAAAAENRLRARVTGVLYRGESSLLRLSGRG
ncbi:MAG: TOBE domain-containing protein, partial [Geminicoccaceae bacterium]|nr:TOBE domain-containing protein [Geminicoccaceae bacterium]